MLSIIVIIIDVIISSTSTGSCTNSRSSIIIIIVNAMLFLWLNIFCLLFQVRIWMRMSKDNDWQMHVCMKEIINSLVLSLVVALYISSVEL